MADEPIISVRNLTKSFSGKVVLDSLSFDVEPGEILVVMGGSGSGKSTTLRLMIQSFPPDSGEILMFGQNICEMTEAEFNQVRKRFGVLFQSGALYNSMTVAENVALALQEHTDLGQEIIDIQVKIKLELVGLREHADKYPAQISGGMKKRAGLARALALDPEILFYDEPSAGLDPVTSAEIDQLIIDLSKKGGVTSIVVTHEMDSAFSIADRMAMLDKGKMICVREREYYESLRDYPEDTIEELDTVERLIRQFVRGDAEGPISQRREATKYADDLLGIDRIEVPRMPSIEATRIRHPFKKRGQKDTKN